MKQTHVRPANQAPFLIESRFQTDDLPETQPLTDPFHPGNETANQLASTNKVPSEASAAAAQANTPIASAPPVRLLGTLTRADEAYAILVVGDSTLSLKAGDTLPDQTSKLLRIDVSSADIQTPDGVQRLAFANNDANVSPSEALHSPPGARLQRHRLTGAAS